MAKERRSTRTLNLFCVLATVVSGCGAAKAYPGPARPDDEVATLEARADVKVVTLDGKPAPDSPSSRWLLLPGEHQLAVEFMGAEAYRDPLPVQFAARAGANYQVKRYQLGASRELAGDEGPVHYETFGVMVMEENEAGDTCYFGWGRIIAGQRSVDPRYKPPPIERCP